MEKLPKNVNITRHTRSQEIINYGSLVDFIQLLTHHQSLTTPPKNCCWVWWLQISGL